MAGYSSVPVLETQRTILRAHRLDDFEDCVALWSDPNVVRYIAPAPFTRSEIWVRLLKYVGHWQLMGFGFWAVECRATGEFLGEVGFMEHRRETVPSHEGVPEAGWMLKPETHGKGLATEAMGAALNWADKQLKSDKTICLVDPGHAASIRVAEKLEFQNHANIIFNDTPAMTMERFRINP